MAGIAMGALAGATFVTPDLDAAVAAYDTYLGYRGAAPEAVGFVLAEQWGCPAAAASRMVTLRPESGENRFIRLVEDRCPAPPLLTTYGWTAAEIIVQDVDALADRLAGGPFQILAPPAVLDFDFTDKIRAMQVAGPGGEILYLTEVAGDVPGFDLPHANSFVGALFIAVLGAPSIEAGARPYIGLGAKAGPAMQARIDILSRAHGLPLETRHSLATVALPDRSLIEVDHFPQRCGPRPTSANGLPCGIAIMTFEAAAVPDVALPRTITGECGELIELVRSTYNEKV